MKLIKLIVTFFSIGNAEIAPGTIASLATVVLFYVFAMHLSVFSFILIILTIIVLAFVTVRIYTTDLLEKDRSEIVIDEVIGQSISLLPLLIFKESAFTELYLCIISLLFFRFFDIIKPFPINKFDNMNSPFGIIFDDILAGTFSAILLIVILIL
jgi:phosphatidylglycerophosphatase A